MNKVEGREGVKEADEEGREERAEKNRGGGGAGEWPNADLD